MIEEKKPISHVKFGNYYLREIIDFADFAFGETFIDAKLNRAESCFEVWVNHNVDKKEKKKFEERFKQCKIRIFEEKTESKR